MANLVIVESPAKAKTIAKYLGRGFEVMASMGHLRDLPKSTLGVDIENNFDPRYIAIKGKGPLIKEIRTKVAKADKVYLATDPDREGEAISWHIKELFALPDEKAFRVTFNEITERAVKNGVASPRVIDQDLVDAQQARRILDRIVGYQLSPLLWQKVRRGLSAGRVQSVATKIVVDREREITAFVAEEYWTIAAELQKLDSKSTFFARFHGDASGKIELHCEEDAAKVLSAVDKKDFRVKAVKKGKKVKQPAPPFITSTLQQESSRRLNFPAKKTMAVAQALYEGVEVEGRGLIGLITYMRTDSLRLSDQAVDDGRAFILSKYGQEYLPEKKRVFKTKGGAQDAHEAIRPTYPELTPQMIKGNLTGEQYRLYKIIWERFVACQMAAALYDTVSADIENSGYIFKASGSTVTFKGFTVLYEEGQDEEPETTDDSKLPPIDEGEILKNIKITEEQKFTQPPLRYTEATLIRTLEENGIGRPSTYAPTIGTILDREYVKKEGKLLSPTNLGEVVTDLMIDKFKDIVNVKFTAHMEEDLDSIEHGEQHWKAVLTSFYTGFEKDLTTAREDLADTRIAVPDEVTDIPCDLCGKMMIVKSGRFGKFLACPGYPECKNTKPITKDSGGFCPICGGKVLQKKSKNGNKYFGCEAYPGCTFMTWDTPMKNNCPKCNKTLFRHISKEGRSTVCLSPECDYQEIHVKYKQKEAAEEGAEKKPAAKKTAAKKAPAKKTAAKKAPAKKTAKKDTEGS